MSRILAALMLALPFSTPAAAQEVVATYAAYIGEQDLYNSNGQRLSTPAQVLRQDRANYHRFGVAQAGDEWDPLFGSAENRAAMDAMLAGGYMDPAAAQVLTNGGGLVLVQIFGSGGVGSTIQVSVAR